MSTISKPPRVNPALVYGSPLGFTLLACVFTLFISAAQATLAWERKEITSTAKVADKSAAVTFKFTNNGTRTVTIYSTTTSCGCTAAALSKKLYAAGESGEIPVTFMFGGRTGQQTQTVSVCTDDEGSDAELKLVVTIPRLFTVTPEYLFWRPGEELKPKQSILKINPEGAAGQLTLLSSEPRVKVSAEAVTPGREYKITITPDAGITGPMVHSIITIETDLPDIPKATTHMYAFVKH